MTLEDVQGRDINQTLIVDGTTVPKEDMEASFLDLYFYLMMLLCLIVSTLIISIVTTLMMQGRSRSSRGCYMVALVSTFFVSMVSLASRIEMVQGGEVLAGWRDCRIFPVLTRIGSTAEILCVSLICMRKGWAWKKRGRRVPISAYGASWKIASLWIFATVLEAPLAFFCGIQGVPLQNIHNFKCCEDWENTWIIPAVYGFMYSVCRLTILSVVIIRRCKHVAHESRLLKAAAATGMPEQQSKRNMKRLAVLNGEMIYLELFIILKAGLEIHGGILMVRTALFVEFREAIEANETLMLHMDFIRVALQPWLLLCFNLNLRSVLLNTACVLTLATELPEQANLLRSRQQQQVDRNIGRSPEAGRSSSVTREMVAERMEALGLSSRRYLKPKRCHRKYRARKLSALNTARMESIMEEDDQSDSEQYARSCPALNILKSLDGSRESECIRYCSSQPHYGSWNPFTGICMDGVGGSTRRVSYPHHRHHGALLQGYYSYHPWTQAGTEFCYKEGGCAGFPFERSVSSFGGHPPRIYEHELISPASHPGKHFLACSRRMRKGCGEIVAPPGVRRCPVLVVTSQPELGKIGREYSRHSEETESSRKQQRNKRVTRQKAVDSTSPPPEGVESTSDRIDALSLVENVRQSEELHCQFDYTVENSEEEEKSLIGCAKGSWKKKQVGKSLSRSVSFPASVKRKL